MEEFCYSNINQFLELLVSRSIGNRRLCSGYIQGRKLNRKSFSYNVGTLEEGPTCYPTIGGTSIHTVAYSMINENVNFLELNKMEAPSKESVPLI